MAQVTIANLSATDGLYIGELYTTIPANGSVVITRSMADLSRMRGLQRAVSAGQAAVAVTLESFESSSGFVSSSAIQAPGLNAVTNPSLEPRRGG
jgi:hypothetical protein